MRLGIVRGHLTLTPAVESFRGKTLVVVEPVVVPVSRPTALSPIWVTWPLKVLLG